MLLGKCIVADDLHSYPLTGRTIHLCVDMLLQLLPPIAKHCPPAHDDKQKPVLRICGSLSYFCTCKPEKLTAS